MPTKTPMKAPLPFNVYDAAGIGLLLFAFIAPDTAYYSFVQSVFQAFAILSAPQVSNLAFTVLELRAMLIIFAVLFLSPRLLQILKLSPSRGGRGHK